MKSIASEGLQALSVLVVAIAGYFITCWFSNRFFPEKGCVSLQGFFWGILYFLFFFVTIFRLNFDKPITAKIIIRNLLICIGGPVILTQILSVL